MKFPKFFLGLVIGVGVGLIVWYWQKSTSAEDGALAVLDRLAIAEARVRELEARLRLKNQGEITPQDQPPEVNVKSEESSEEVSKEPVPSAETHQEPVPSENDAFPDQDDLQKIRGVGPTFAKRLNDAGILTFNDLAQQSPENLQQITGLKSWHSADPQDWIDEAKQYLESN